MLGKLWDRSLTSSRAITRSEPQHIVPNLRSDLCWETLSKPLSQKATHGNHVYFFPLTSLHYTHTAAAASGEKTHKHKWIRTCIKPNLSFTHKCETEYVLSKNTMLVETHSHTCARETEDYSVSGPQSQNRFITKLWCSLEKSKVPLEELQQGREIRPNTTHWILSPSTAQTSGNTDNVIYSPASVKCC